MEKSGFFEKFLRRIFLTSSSMQEKRIFFIVEKKEFFIMERKPKCKQPEGQVKINIYIWLVVRVCDPLEPEM